MKYELEQLRNWSADKQQKLTSQQVQQLLEHLEILREWNQVHNLTAVKNQDMLDYHVLDSLSVVPHLQSLLEQPAKQSLKLLDVGSGAGFPGVVLACVFPSLCVILLEANQKKCRFLTQLKLRLGLNNLRILPERVENHQQKYPLIISRATFNPDQLWLHCQHLMSKSSYLLGMLSGSQYQQHQQIISGWLPTTHHSNWQKLQVPTRLGKRYLLCITEANKKGLK